MIEVIGFWVALLAGVFLLFMSAFGIRAFTPRIWKSEAPASRRLALAIVVGFLGAAMNTLYWQVWGHIAILQGWIDIAQLRYFGSYLDAVFKGASSLAVYLHLSAWHMSLPAKERYQWTVMGMAFYPSGTGFLARALNGFRNDSVRK